MAAITDLAAASSVAPTDLLVINQSGTDRKVTAGKFLYEVQDSQSMGNGAVLALSTWTAVTNGLLFIVEVANANVAIFNVRGGNNAVIEVSDPSSIASITKDTASSLNVYYDSGYKVQNYRGFTSTVVIVGMGT